MSTILVIYFALQFQGGGAVPTTLSNSFYSLVTVTHQISYYLLILDKFVQYTWAALLLGIKVA